MADFSDRLERLIEFLGITPYRLSKETGASEVVISNARSGKNYPSYEFLNKILNKYKVINANWLVTGEGEMLKREGADVHGGNENVLGLPRVVTVDSAEQDNVVLVPVKARAGYLLGYGDPEYIGTLPGYRFPNVRGGTFRAFEVEGHSMTPTLKNGDIVIGEWCERLDHIMDDRVYVIVTKNEGIVIKRVFNMVSHDGIIVAKSDAASLGEVYRNIEIDPANILELWHVRSFLSADLSFPSSVYDRLDSMEAKIKALESRFGPPT